MGRIKDYIIKEQEEKIKDWIESYREKNKKVASMFNKNGFPKNTGSAEQMTDRMKVDMDRYVLSRFE